jgi:hypothetical protein
VHVPLPDKHPFYRLVGQVTSEWAHLEHALDLIIWRMAGVEEAKGACLTGQIMGASPRFLAIIALATLKQVNEKVIEEVRDLMRRTFDVQEARNRAIHDPWFISGGATGQVAQFKSMPKKELVYGMKDVDEAEIKKLIERIRRRSQDALSLQDKLCKP